MMSVDWQFEQSKWISTKKVYRQSHSNPTIHSLVDTNIAGRSMKSIIIFSKEIYSGHT